MPNLIVEKQSEKDFPLELLKKLKAKITAWQKKNDFDICILIKELKSEKIYVFKFEKNSWAKLEKGVEHNLLKASIDIEIQKWTEQLKDKFQINFFVGYSTKELEKLMNEDTSKTASKEKPKLNMQPIEPNYSLSQVVLSQEVKKEIDSVVSLLKNMNKIYYDWGFCEIDPVPRSIVNLWGPSGTGKTMTVHAIAKEMGKKILVLNYADIESKYVGEAPKNLVAAFDLAEKENAVIFFDEADSFLGKRITNVDSGSEQAINSLRSQMLMKLEEFNGIAFFATNLHENYDKAFESRILKHIEFKLPNLDERKMIIKGKLPSKAPCTCDVRNDDGTFNDKLLTKLSKIVEGFSGREIKNCILETMVRAIQTEEQIITCEIILETFKAKKQEADSIVRKEKERKEKLSNAIKKNLNDKNYNIQKTDEGGKTIIISAKDAKSKNKTKNKTKQKIKQKETKNELY